MASPEDRLRIYAAFGLTAEEAEAFEASPGYQSYVAAKAEADAFEAAFRENLAALAADVSADLTAKITGG